VRLFNVADEEHVVSAVRLADAGDDGEDGEDGDAEPEGGAIVVGDG
jgi:DNA gyrase subunit A